MFSKRPKARKTSAPIARGAAGSQGRPLAHSIAVRPASAPLFPLREGYRREIYRDTELNLRMPVLTAALSADKVFPILMDLYQPLGEVVDFILESSHDLDPTDLDAPVTSTWERTDIDLPVLTSILYDFEDLILGDGCTGIAVLNADRDYEVHFDEHKLLYLYGPDLSAFEAILQKHGVIREDDLIVITEEQHIHSTSDEFYEKLQELRQVIGVEDEVESPSW